MHKLSFKLLVIVKVSYLCRIFGNLSFSYSSGDACSVQAVDNELNKVVPTVTEQVPIDRGRHFCGLQGPKIPEEDYFLPEEETMKSYKLYLLLSWRRLKNFLWLKDPY